MFDLPVFVVNLDRCPERLRKTIPKIEEAGFSNIVRWRAVDGRNQQELDEGWASHGNPKFDPARTEFVTYKGEQGCALTHLNLWRHIYTNGIEKAVVFEDDVMFHKDWKKLAPMYMMRTPTDYDLIYMGSQMEMKCDANICRVPVYCTHAYVITCEGARKLYDLITTGFPRGICAIDSLLIEMMYRYMATGEVPFNWWVWNGMMYYDARAYLDPEWSKRNSGLVFQDPSFGTDVKPRNAEQAAKLI